MQRMGKKLWKNALPMVSEVLLGVLPQALQQLTEGVTPHHDLVDGDVGFAHVRKGLIESGVQVPAKTSS